MKDAFQFMEENSDVIDAPDNSERLRKAQYHKTAMEL